MTDQLLASEQYQILAGRYRDILLRDKDCNGYYVFYIQVEQKSQDLDIDVQIMDQHNFTVWAHTLSAISAGASPGMLPSYLTDISAKLRWGRIAFVPPSASDYVLVLDNTHSRFTPKTVTFEASWVSTEWPARVSVRRTMRDFNWTEVWQLFEKGEANMQAGALSDSCYNMRDALTLLTKKVTERLSGKPVIFPSGKKPDIGVLKGELDPYVPDYIPGMVARFHSIASELAHPEKKVVKDVTPAEVILIHRLTYSMSAYLASLVSKS